MSGTVTTLICMLLTASMMWPSEGAMEGDGLHLVVLWFVAGVIALGTSRAGDGCGKWDAGGIGLALMVLGYWVSTRYVFVAEGDRRAALNLSFEWTAVGVACWLVRRAVCQSGARHAIVSVVAGLGLGASLLGIVQHHVTYARQAQWYQTQRSELDAALAENSLQSSIQRRKIESEFAATEIPLSGAARELFERRLLASSEPVGPFALANTLGGLLAVVLVLIAAGVLQALKSTSRMPFTTVAAILPVLLVVAYCLVLTKSRTAWVAGLAGAVFLLLRDGRSFGALKKVLLPAGLLISAAVITAAATGALDREVILESPRSLQFRLLYWMGAAGVIREKPIFGAGPGNFRQSYLAHKPVESSEEILDPHNILLDAWCSAGIIGFAGICFLGWHVFRSAAGSIVPDDPSAAAVNPPARPSRWRGAATRGIAAGVLIHLGWRWVNGGQFWDTTATDFASSQNAVLLVPLGAFVGGGAVSLLPPLSARAVAAARGDIADSSAGCRGAADYDCRTFAGRVVRLFNGEIADGRSERRGRCPGSGRFAVACGMHRCFVILYLDDV